MNKRKAAVFLLALCLLPAGALEVKQGMMKLVIDESSARISLYKLVDIAKGRYEPLFYDLDPRTSYATLSFNGRQVKLGDAADYRFSVARTDTGARIEFHSSSCVIDEDLDFVNSVGAALADGVKLSFKLTNVSQKEADIGLRFLLDTNLGEKSGTHFRTDLREKVTGESLLEPRTGDSWLSSPGEKLETMAVLKGSGLDGPDKVILANWKRINEEPWYFEPVPGRSFTLLPYSVNDSAVALFWMPKTLAQGESRSLSLILGLYNEKGYPLQTQGLDAGTQALFESTVLASTKATDEKSAMEADLIAVRDLLSRMDQALSSGKPLSADQIDAWKEILETLEARKKGK
jgi:hypothetical protein